jgi:hypothetical protein
LILWLLFLTIKTSGSATRGSIQKKGITFNILLWTQVILDESLLILWKIIIYFFHICTKNKVF